MAELVIGTLTLGEGGWSWHLQYAACGHTQEFARDEWLASRDQAERYVWRCNRTCLTCQAWQREQQARLGRRAAAMPLVPAPLINEDTS